MNVANLVQSALLGFLTSLIVLEILGVTLRRRWPVQTVGLQFERRLLPWLIALAAGPALFFDATERYRLRRTGGLVDCITVWTILAVWSASYGAVMVTAFRHA